MQLHIENIGPIGSAQIDLTGLTVIGGMNDTGKSTIGKVLFAIIKAIRNKEQEAINTQRSRVNGIVSELISELRSAVGPAVSPNNIYSSVSSVFENYLISNSVGGDSNLEETLNSVRHNILREINRRMHMPPMEGRAGISKLLEIPNLERLNNDILERYISRFRKALTITVDNDTLYYNSINKTFRIIFRGEINNQLSPEAGNIILSDNNEEFLKATFIDNKLAMLMIQENVIGSLFEDVTLLESPFALNSKLMFPYHPGIDDESSLLSGDYSTHDLIQKLNFASKESLPSNPLESTISDKISEVIKGRIYYDSQSEEFQFSTANDVNVKINNTASGVKTLGIIQMLASAGVLSGSNLLIIDEPEVHLHPEWQILYAEIISILVKKYNIYCLVSSHSPYFLQSLEAYIKINDIENLTRFYISKKDEGICSFSDITNDTEQLYKLLADPMKKIAFLRAKAQNE